MLLDLGYHFTVFFFPFLMEAVRTVDAGQVNGRNACPRDNGGGRPVHPSPTEDKAGFPGEDRCAPATAPEERVGAWVPNAVPSRLARGRLNADQVSGHEPVLL